MADNRNSLDYSVLARFVTLGAIRNGDIELLHCKGENSNATITENAKRIQDFYENAYQALIDSNDFVFQCVEV